MTIKAGLKQGGDGTAIPAGFVGEVIETLLTSTSSYTATADTWVAQGETISLTAGVWLVNYASMIGCENISGSPILSIRLYNTTDAAEVTGSRSCLAPGLGTGVVGYFWVGNSVAVAISGSKTYRLEIACNAAAAAAKGRFITDLTGSITGNDASNKIFAIRIA